MADAPKILGTDSLRTAYPKMNQSIDNANEALKKAESATNTANSAINTAGSAVNVANNAKTKAELIQEQFDQIVIEGDSSPAIAHALIGTPYNTLKEKHEAIDAQLAQATHKVGKKANLSEYEHLKNGTDWTYALNQALSKNAIVEVNEGDYNISNKINVLNRRLVGLGRVTLKLTDNVDGVEWRTGGSLSNIRVDAAGITGYSSRCFIFRATSVTQHRVLYENITAFMKENVADNTSNGIGLLLTTKESDSATSSNAYIAYTTNNGFTCNGGGKGFVCEIAANSVNGGNWIQGNTFSNCIISSLKQFDLPKLASGNAFPGYIAQFKHSSVIDSIADLRGSFNFFGWDPVASHIRPHDFTHLSGVVDPFAVAIPNDARRLAINSNTFTVEDGMVTNALGWYQDIYQELKTPTVKGFYEIIEHCEGKELSNKWSLVNASQQPLGVVDTRVSHGMTIVQTDPTQPAKLWLDNCFITRDRYPRMLATLRQRYGGDVASIAGSITQLGFLSGDHNTGYWIEIDTNSPGTKEQAVIYAVTMNGEGNITKELIKNKNGTNLLALYGDKITVEIITKENSVLFNVSLEAYNQKISYAEGHFYNRSVRASRCGTQEITTSLPNATTVIAPTMRYNSAITSTTRQQKALLYMHVKSRYIGG